MSDLAQLLVNGLVTGSILALAAVGVSLVYGILRVINFAQGDFLSYGAYAGALVNVTWGEPMVLATAAAMVAVAILSVAVEFLLWRPLRRRGGGLFTLFVSSLGVALVLRGILYLVAGPNPESYRVNRFSVYDFGPVRLSESQLIAVVVACVAIGLVGLLFASSGLGKSMRALANNRELAAVAGVNTDRIIVYTWVLTGGLAGIAGVLEGLVQSSFDPNLGVSLLLAVFGAVVLGGIGSAYGALLGGLLLGIVMELSTWTALAGGADPVWKPVVGFVVLIAVLLVRPQGLFGRARLQ